MIFLGFSMRFSLDFEADRPTIFCKGRCAQNLSKIYFKIFLKSLKDFFLTEVSHPWKPNYK